MIRVYKACGGRQIPKINVARRGQYDIIAEILSSARDGARTSCIMYKSNLDFRQKERYLSLLLNVGLIRIKTNPPLVYETTEFGLKWLENYKKLVLEYISLGPE